MATYYARAGGGNWGTASTWSLSSNGPADGSVPTASDDVILDASSGNVTANGTSGSPSLCRDLTCTGYTGTLTQGSTAYLDIYGSCTMVAGMTLANVTGSRIRFQATSTGKTVSTGGKTWAHTEFIGVGGGWTLQDSLTWYTSSTLTLSNGALVLNNQTLNGGPIVSTGTATRSLNCGSSTITCRGWNITTSLSLTIGTANIVFSGAATFTGAGKTYNNLTLKGTGVTHTISDANTFADLTRTPSSSSQNIILLGANQTVTGTFNGNGSSNNRLLIMSTVRGTSRTITAATVSSNHAIYDGITGAGAGSWNLSGGEVGDCGNNSGITFTTPATIYFKHTGSGTNQWNTSNVWKTTSGGSTNTRMPLPQDTAIFDANSFGAGSLTLAFGPAVFPKLDATAVTNNPTFNFGTAMRVYGDILLASAMSVTGSSAVTLCGNNSGSNDFDTGGATMSATLPITIDMIAGNTLNLDHGGTVASVTITSGTLNMQNNLTSSGQLTDTGGSFNLNSYTFAISGLTFNSGGTRTYDMGSGVVQFTGTGNLITYTNVSGLTFTRGTSLFQITNTSASSKTFSLAGLTFYDFEVFGASGAGTVTFTLGGTMNSLALQPNANIRISNSTTLTLTNPPAWNGTSGNLITVASSSGSSNCTIACASGTVDCDYLSLTRVTASGATPFYAGSHSTDGGNNTNWSFTDAPAGGVTGDGAFTLAAATVAGTAAVKVQAAADFTLAAFSLASTGTVKVQGAAAITLAALSLSATASAVVKGAGAFTLGALTLASTASVKVQAAAGVSLAAVTIAGAGAVKVQGAGAFTLGDLTAVGSIGFSSTLDGAFTLAPVTIAGAGQVKVQGTSAFALASLSATGTGQVIIKGDAAITLGPVFTSSAAAVPVVGNGAITLEDIGLSATASVKVQAEAAVELESALFEGTGAVIVRGAAAITLDPFTVSGSTQKPGTVLFPESLTARVFKSSALGGRSHKTSALQAVSLQRSEIGITIR